MKTCSMCKKTKSKSEFYKRYDRNVSSFHAYCKECFAEKNRARNLIEGVKEQDKLNKAIRRQHRRDYINDYKIKAKCKHCGYNKNSCVLEFHHIKPKTNNISMMVDRVLSVDKIQAEVDKCIVLCANCHRELHNPI